MAGGCPPGAQPWRGIPWRSERRRCIGSATSGIRRLLTLALRLKAHCAMGNELKSSTAETLMRNCEECGQWRIPLERGKPTLDAECPQPLLSPSLASGLSSPTDTHHTPSAPSPTLLHTSRHRDIRVIGCGVWGMRREVRSELSANACGYLLIDSSRTQTFIFAVTLPDTTVSVCCL